MLNYIIWDLDPEIFALGPLKIRYYGLLFAGGFAIGYSILKKIFIKENIKIEWLDSLLMYVLAGTILGARLGHCLFYEPEYYLTHPIEILKIYKGGLASHGGAIGILVALWFYSKKVSKRSPIWTLDRLVIVVALAGCMIRVGNLANSEIYGHNTDSAIGFVHVKDSYFGRYINEPSIAKFTEDYDVVKGEKFDNKETATIELSFNKYVKKEQEARSLAEFRVKPLLAYREGSDASKPNLYMPAEGIIEINNVNGKYIASFPIIVTPKHPTHIYEATCYFLTFVLLMFIYYKGGAKRQGLIFGIFLVCIFASRFGIEMIKENQVATEVGHVLNNGQKLSIPFILAGIYYVFASLKPQKNIEVSDKK